MFTVKSEVVMASKAGNITLQLLQFAEIYQAFTAEIIVKTRVYVI